MTDLRLAVRVRRTAVRTVTGVGVLLVTGAVVAAPLLHPGAAPTPPVEAALTVVDVPPAPTTLVCPGPLRLATEPEPGGDVLYDPQFDPSPEESQSVLRAASVAPEPGDEAADGELRVLGGDAAVGGGALETGRDAAVTDVVPGEALVVATEAADEVPAWSAGALRVRTAAGDLRGLAAASCRRPGAEAWLVGGSTSLGSSARLVLQNPGSTPATVDVELWGPAGAVELAGAPEYLVPPGAERVVLLEGVAAEQSRIVVHLSASGGLVTAYLQDSQLRGLVPAGVDYVVPGRAPAQRQVVPALSVTESAIDGADTAALRLLVPGDRDGTARISLLGPDGPQELPGADEVELDAGAVLDVALAGLAPGDWTAVVESDVPVVAAALLTRGTGVGRPAGETPSRAPLDRAWVPSVATGVSGPLALPGGRGALTLGVATDDDVTGAARAELEVLDADGASLGTRDLRLAAGTTTSIPLEALLGPDVPAPDAAAVVLRTEDPRVAWGAVLVEPSTEGDLVATVVPVVPARAQPEVLVRLR